MFLLHSLFFLSIIFFPTSLAHVTEYGHRYPSLRPRVSCSSHFKNPGRRTGFKRGQVTVLSQSSLGVGRRSSRVQIYYPGALSCPREQGHIPQSGPSKVTLPSSVNIPSKIRGRSLSVLFLKDEEPGRDSSSQEGALSGPTTSHAVA